MINELHLDELQISYNGVSPVFSPVTQRLHRGEVVAITGNNGAGKSTLLMGIAGLLRPFHGRVYLMSDNVEYPFESLRHRCGYVAPGLALYDELQAWEQIEFDAKLRGQESCLSVAKDLLRTFSLDKRADSMISSFSTGMKQRLKIVMATYFSPDVLLLDEPTSNLDDDGFKAFSEVIDKTAEQGCIVVLATNDQRDRALCSREFRLGSPSSHS